MPDFQHLLLFIAAGWLLNLTPGPDVLYIVTHSLRSGARAGIVAGLGITGGCFVHIFAAAAGVGALLAASATAFNVLKWIGAAYLVWIGVKLLLPDGEGEHEINPATSVAGAVKTIIVADFVMSVDNVIGVAGAAGDSLVLLGCGEPERLEAAAVSGDFFQTMQVAPERGRWLEPRETEEAVLLGAPRYLARFARRRSTGTETRWRTASAVWPWMRSLTPR